MIRMLIMLFPLFVYAESLKSLLEFANEKSELVVAKSLLQEAKAQSVDAQKSSYYPTLDTGAFYQTVDERNPFFPGDNYGAFAKLSFDVYDGGKKSSLVSQAKKEYEASQFVTESTRQSLNLEIVKNFFNMKSLESTLLSKNEVIRALKEKLERVKSFYVAKLATKDDVDRLQAAYDTNIYEMESMKFQIVSIKRVIQLQVGKTIESFENSHFKPFSQQNMQLTHDLQSSIAQKDALRQSADAIDSAYYPQLRVEDTYSVNGYDRSDALHPEGVDNQNKVLLSLNMRLFDNGSISKHKQSVLSHVHAMDTQIAYATKAQKVQYDLAKRSIQTSMIQIKSAKSALKAAQSAYETITKKYDAGIVDNIVYLDALSSRDSAKSLYAKSLNDLQIAYATYYFYAGKNIEEFLQ